MGCDLICQAFAIHWNMLKDYACRSARPNLNATCCLLGVLDHLKVRAPKKRGCNIQMVRSAYVLRRTRTYGDLEYFLLETSGCLIKQRHCTILSTDVDEGLRHTNFTLDKIH